VKEEREKSKFGFPPSQAGSYSVSDCRGLVKTLVCGVKTITWGCASCKVSSPYIIHTSKDIKQPLRPERL
jgi:transformation/transcription domain-associated protein